MLSVIEVRPDIRSIVVRSRAQERAAAFNEDGASPSRRPRACAKRLHLQGAVRVQELELTVNI